MPSEVENYKQDLRKARAVTNSMDGELNGKYTFLQENQNEVGHFQHIYELFAGNRVDFSLQCPVVFHHCGQVKAET